MNQKRLLLFGLLLVNCYYGAKGGNPTVTCPQYVEEGTTLNCDCIAPADVTTVPQLTWPGHSVTSQLTLTNVSRTLNGTKYTCEMTSLGVTTSTVYTMQVAYGPENKSISISGLAPFPTNGSQALTLTCLATEVNPRPRFSWSGVQCQNGNQDDTCIFNPQPISDDQKRVACVVMGEFIGSAVKFASAIFIVDLLYPPPSPPTMTSLDTTTFLRTGDVINCTVRGGRPAVSSITFKCSDPITLQDQGDVIEKDDVTGVTSVVSQVTVRTSRRRESRSLLCQCQAKWLPEESLYSAVTTHAFPTEYKASVTNFTLNGIKTPLTVKENDVTSVALTCSTDGRPKPNITLSKMGAEGVLSQQSDVTVSVMTLSDVRCEMTGVYVCSVTNGLARTDQKLVSMVVLCGPRAVNASAERENQQSPPILTRHGITFRVVSNPVPDQSAYTIVNATTASTGSLAASLQNARLFVTSCSKVKDVDHMALCRVTPRRVTSQQLGVYAVTVTNLHGSYDFHFKVEEEILPLPSDGASRRRSDVTSAAAIAGGILGALVIVVIIIVIGFLFVRRKWTGHKMGIESEQPKSQDDAEFTDHMNPGYVSTDAIDVSVQNEADLPRQTSSNFSMASSQYDEITSDDVSRTSLRPPQGNEDTIEAEKSRKKRSPRVSFYMGSEQNSHTTVSTSSKSPRNPPSEPNRPQKSPRYKANESIQALKSPRNKQIKNKGPKSPRNKVNELRFPQHSPRSSSPPQSPRNNTFMTDEDGATFDERPSTSMSGDYAEIDSDCTPRNGRPDTVAKPRARRSEYVDLGDPYPKPSPRRATTNGVEADSDPNTPTPLPRGSVRGPLGDIYRTIDKVQKSRKSNSQNGAGGWMESELPDNTNAEYLTESENMDPGYDDDGDYAKGNNFGDFQHSDVPGSDLPERADLHKPGTKLKKVMPSVATADDDRDVYDDARSSRVRSKVKITSL